MCVGRDCLVFVRWRENGAEEGEVVGLLHVSNQSLHNLWVHYGAETLANVCG